MKDRENFECDDILFFSENPATGESDVVWDGKEKTDEDGKKKVWSKEKRRWEQLTK